MRNFVSIPDGVIKTMTRFTSYLLILITLLVTACKPKTPVKKESVFGSDSVENASDYDLSRIQESGELIMLTLYGPNTYFTYRDVDLGYQHDLCALFGQDIGVRVRVEVARDQQDMIRKLKEGEGDIIVYNLPINRQNSAQVRFCGNKSTISQLLVQRKEHKLRSISQLKGKEVYVTEDRYYQTLTELNKSINGGIKIHKVSPDDKTTAELISDVADGKIDYTLCDNDMKEINQSYFPNLDITLKAGIEQHTGWAVRKDSPELAQALDDWYNAAKNTTAFRQCGRRYITGFSIAGSGTALGGGSSRGFFASPMLNSRAGIISQYDPYFRQYSMTIPWDWRLLAAQCYQESGFNPNATSWAGAQGLMQMMPSTAAQEGLSLGMINDPEQNIAAASRHIRGLNRYFSDIADRRERINFILAAYNAGRLHIRDAMNLARKHGRNPYVWDGSVDHFVLMMSDERYYNDPVVKSGYFRGDETYNYVKAIRGRWNYYKSRTR